MATPKKTSTRKSATPVRQSLPIRRPDASPATSSSWDLTAKVSLAITAFVVPLIVGAWTSDQWEIHKAMVLLLGVTVAWLAFFIGRMRRPEVRWQWRPLDWCVLVLGLGALIGTVTSMNPWTSLAGLQGAYGETLPIQLAFLSLYFLVGQLFHDRRERLILWSSLLAGIGLSLLLQMLQFSNLSLFSGTIGKDLLFSTLANSSLQVAILAAVTGTAGLLLWPLTTERWSRYGLALVVTLAWLVMMFLGQAVAWAIFSIGMVVVVAQQAMKSSTTNTKLVVIAVLLAAAGMLGQFFNLSSRSSLPSTAETSLSQTTSAGTAFSAVVHRPVLGTGPNTWFHAFAAYRPLSFNQDSHWSGRYLRAGMEWAQVLATQGIVGLTAWIGILLFVGWEAWQLLRRQPSFTPLLSLFLVGVVTMTLFLSSWSLVLLTVVWIAFGLLRGKIAAANRQPQTKTVWPTIGFALTVILAVVVWYPAIRVYASQIATKIGQNRLTAATTDPKPAMTALKQARSFDPANTDAGVLLVNAQLMQLQSDLQNSNIPAAQQDLQTVQQTMQDVVNHDKNNPSVYETQNNLLNTLAAYLPTPEVQANTNFAALRKLEPSNPIHDVGYGQTLLVMRARAAAATTASTTVAQQSAYLTQAIQAFNDALRKKPDYLQARYARAQAYLAAGQYQLAFDDLENLTAVSPSEPSFWSAKGQALAGLGQLDQATSAFEQALKLGATDPSIYLAYSQVLNDAKKTTEAKDVLNRGLKALPSNTQLQDALKVLGS